MGPAFKTERDVKRTAICAPYRQYPAFREDGKI